jgi:predicted ribosome quality control (RQC) complex YloA/Tae2 family protein
MKLFYRELSDNKTITYVLGQNAYDNDSIIDNADKNDWWFHMNNKPSSHCIVESNIINSNDIKFATDLIKTNTKYVKGEKNQFCYIQIKYLKKTKKKGQVKFINEPNIVIL